MNTDNLRCQYCDVGLFSAHEPEELSYHNCEICGHLLIDEAQSFRSSLRPDHIPKMFVMGTDWQSFGVICIHFNDKGLWHFDKLVTELKRLEQVDSRQSLCFGKQIETTVKSSPILFASTATVFSMLEEFIWNNELGTEIQVSYFIFEEMDRFRSFSAIGQFLLEKVEAMTSNQTAS